MRITRTLVFAAGATLLVASLLHADGPQQLIGTGAPPEGRSDDPSAAFVNGWNYVHATNCYTKIEANGQISFFVLPSEGGWWYIPGSDPIRQSVMSTLAAACTAGNLVGFNVVDAQGRFDQVVTFPNK